MSVRHGDLPTGEQARETRPEPRNEVRVPRNYQRPYNERVPRSYNRNLPPSQQRNENEKAEANARRQGKPNQPNIPNPQAHPDEDAKEKQETHALEEWWEKMHHRPRFPHSDVPLPDSQVPPPACYKDDDKEREKNRQRAAEGYSACLEGGFAIDCLPLRDYVEEVGPNVHAPDGNGHGGD